MDRTEIVAALTELGALLDAAGITADLYVVGGAAIALAYDERQFFVEAVLDPAV